MIDVFLVQFDEKLVILSCILSAFGCKLHVGNHIVFDEILLWMVNLISVTLSDILLYFVLANDGKYCVDFLGETNFAGPVTFEAGSAVGAFLCFNTVFPYNSSFYLSLLWILPTWDTN